MTLHEEFMRLGLNISALARETGFSREYARLVLLEQRTNPAIEKSARRWLAQHKAELRLSLK